MESVRAPSTWRNKGIQTESNKCLLFYIRIIILMRLAGIPSESGLTLFLKNERENNSIKLELLVLLSHIINN